MKLKQNNVCKVLDMTSRTQALLKKYSRKWLFWLPGLGYRQGAMSGARKDEHTSFPSVRVETCPVPTEMLELSFPGAAAGLAPFLQLCAPGVLPVPLDPT